MKGQPNAMGAHEAKKLGPGSSPSGLHALRNQSDGACTVAPQVQAPAHDVFDSNTRQASKIKCVVAAIQIRMHSFFSAAHSPGVC